METRPRPSREAPPRRAPLFNRERQYRRLARRRTAAPALVIRDEARRLRQSLGLAMLVFVQYGLVAADIRFVSSGNYLGIAVVNVCIAINTWYLTRGIIQAKSKVDRLCYVVGGTTGALIAVLAT